MLGVDTVRALIQEADSLLVRGEGLLKNGQPLKITRAVTEPGALAARFVAAELTVNNGAPTLADHSGYDNATGAETGIVSITGQPNMVKATVAGTGTEGVRFTTFASSFIVPALAGKIGIWVYFQPPIPTVFKIVMTTEAGGSTTNGIDVTWTSNQITPGWNFLVFRMRQPLAYQSGGGGVTELNPYGIVPTPFGTGVDSNIVANNLTKIIFQWQGGTIGNEIYLDSVWTGWESFPQVVLGVDALDSDLINYVLPIFEPYGWVGYVAVPVRVYTSGSKIVYNYEALTSWTGDMETRGPILKAAGWDLVNHTVNHLANGTLTEASEIAYEILGAQPIYSAEGWTRGNEFYASPQSSTSVLAEAVIANCGIKLQRNIAQANVQLTPWGIPNAQNVGASGVGSNAALAYSSITNGTNTNVTGLQVNSKLRNLTDVMIDYGASWFPFWHFVTVLGDTGSGENLTGDNLYITRSALTLWLEYVREKELEGSLRVCRGITGFYYGED